MTAHFIPSPRRFFTALSVLLAAAACGGDVLDDTVATTAGSGGANSDDASSSSGSNTIPDGISVKDADVGNYYDDLPDYANLPWIEEWQLEAEITGPLGNEQKAGAIRGAIEVVEYQGTLYLYVADLGGVRVFTSNDGLSWDNAASTAHVPVGGDDSHLIYTHPYAAVDPDGKLHMFMQTKDPSAEKGGFFISHATSSDGLSFDEPASFLNCAEVLADYDCTSCAHGRITSLPSGGYAIAFSATCQQQNYPKGLSKSFVPGTMMAYSNDLVSWQIDPAAFFPACHDPAFDLSQGKVYMYCASEVDLLPGGTAFDGKAAQLLRFDSDDGRSWTPKDPAGIVRFSDSNGEQIPRDEWMLADVDVHDFGDGTVRMYTPASAGDYPSVFTFTRK
ncbi:MAG: hypothetical protein VB934_15305 [Polyangiaceae bacterium]